jgi:large repetitive protein
MRFYLSIPLFLVFLLPFGVCRAQLFAPVAANDNGSTTENVQVTLNVTSNDTDSDVLGSVDAATVDLNVSDGGTQSFVSVAAGDFSVDNLGNVTYIPTTGFSGNAIISYTVDDNVGTTSNQATINIAVNDRPNIVTDNITTNEDQSTTLNVAANDTDSDGSVNAGTVDLDPASPGIQTTFTTPQGNELSVNLSGVVTLTPELNYNGTENISYTINDNQGATSAPGTIVLNITAVNDAPSISGQNTVQTNEDVAISILTSHLVFADPDNSTGFTVSVSAGANYTFSGTTVTPSSNYNGTLTIPVTISDGTATSNSFPLIVTVNPVNDAPAISSQDPLTTNEDQTIAIDLNDLNVTDIDNSYPTGFSLIVTSGSNYTFSGNTITPASNFNGTLSVNVQVNDGALSSATFPLQISVTAVNDAPSITAQATVTTNEDTPIVLTLSNVTVSDPDNSAGFTLVISSGSNYTFSGTTITPAANFNGTLTVNVQVSDGSLTSASFPLQVGVTPVNDAPTITGQSTVTTNEDTPVVTSVSNITISDPDNSSFTVTVLAGSNYTFSGTTITPALNFNGTLTVNIQVSDGSLASTSFPLQVGVTPVNDAPVITSQDPLTGLL